MILFVVLACPLVRGSSTDETQCLIPSCQKNGSNPYLWIVNHYLWRWNVVNYVGTQCSFTRISEFVEQ